MIPVGAAENVPTFVSLLSEDHTTVAVLMDVTPTKKERVEALASDGANPIRWVEVTRIRDADIEDLFEPDFYLDLVNRSYEGVLPSDLTRPSISDSNPRIAARVASYFKRHDIAGGEFDRNRPAAYLLGKHSQLRGDIDQATVERASALFDRINALLPVNSPMNGSGNGRPPTRSVSNAPAPWPEPAAAADISQGPAGPWLFSCAPTLANVHDPHEFPIRSMAEVYARRWDIEMALKLVKQHLKLRLLWSPCSLTAPFVTPPARNYVRVLHIRILKCAQSQCMLESKHEATTLHTRKCRPRAEASWRCHSR